MKITSEVTNRKAAIIGAGYVGASIAYSLVTRGLARETVLIELPAFAEKALAEVADIRHGIPYMGSSNIYCGDYSDIKDCDMIIVTAGRNRRAGESRLDMAKDNVKIADAAADDIEKYYTKGVIVVVSNPVDIIALRMTERFGLPDGMVFGTGCILDGSRFTNVIADYVGLNSDVVSAHIIGEHGDGQIALWSKVTIAGVPIAEYCKLTGISFMEADKKSMEEKVREMGTRIIKGKGRTHYGIASCVGYIADAILNRRSTIISVSSVLRGEYGLNGIALSLPSIVGANGVDRRLADDLSESEYRRIIETYEKLFALRNVL
jgi:L-lactate dehydrogenase